MSVEIPQTQLEEIVDDALDEIPTPMAMDVCNVRSRPGLSGKIGYRKLKDEIPKDQGGAVLPRGAEIQAHDIEYAEFTYRAQKYAGAGQVTIEDEIEASEYNLDAIAQASEDAVEYARAGIDRAFADYLTGSDMTDGTGESDVYLASWDDGGSTSEPYSTIGNMARDALGADTVVIGGEALEILRSHPDTKEQVSYYSGTGRADYDVVEDAIRGAYRSIRSVYVFDRLYDQAAAGLGLTDTYLFDKSVWVGHQDRLFCIDPDHPNNPTERQEDRATSFSTDITFARFVDFAHPISQLGRYISDVTA